MIEAKSNGPKEKCAVFGAYGEDYDAARLTFFGLYAQQHRGQESSGIASSTGESIHEPHTRMGLVAQVYHEEDLLRLVGPLAIGHNRYSTQGSSDINNAQPIVDSNRQLALAHNGNLFNVRGLAEKVDNYQIPTDGLNDSGLMHRLIWRHISRGASLNDAIAEAYPSLVGTGAFSTVAMTKDTLAAFRDPTGIRPLSIGQLNGGFIVASETCALDTVGATFIRDVRPGELVTIDRDGLHSEQLAPEDPMLDAFEYIYFARPDSMLDGRLVYEVRFEMGKRLAQEYRPDVDIVAGIPDSAIPAAHGYSAARGIHYKDVFAKNRYVHRSFIQPEGHMRRNTVELKLNPMSEVVRGQRILVIDDSIVRSTTSRQFVQKLRRSGAAEVHVGIHSPVIAYPDFYGMDIPTREELVGSTKSIAEICDEIGADSLGYLSQDGLEESIDPNRTRRYSYHVFNGQYPIPISKNIRELVTA